MTNAPNTPTSDGLRAFITTYGYKDLKVASRQYCADIYVDDEHCMTEWFDDLSKAVQFADDEGVTDIVFCKANNRHKDKEGIAPCANTI